MTCPFCRAELMGGDVFCAACGSRLDRRDHDESFVRRTRRKRFRKLALIVAAFLTVAVFWLGSHAPTSSSTPGVPALHQQTQLKCGAFRVGWQVNLLLVYGPVEGEEPTLLAYSVESLPVQEWVLLADSPSTALPIRVYRDSTGIRVHDANSSDARLPAVRPDFKPNG